MLSDFRGVLGQSGILGYWSFFLGYWDIASLKLGYWDIHEELGILGYWLWGIWDIGALVSLVNCSGSNVWFLWNLLWKIFRAFGVNVPINHVSAKLLNLIHVNSFPYKLRIWGTIRMKAPTSKVYPRHVELLGTSLHYIAVGQSKKRGSISLCWL